jgi:hypothetical protein
VKDDRLYLHHMLERCRQKNPQSRHCPQKIEQFRLTGFPSHRVQNTEMSRPYQPRPTAPDRPRRSARLRLCTPPCLCRFGRVSL